MSKPCKFQWDMVYPDWCAHILTITQIAEKWGMTESAVRKHAQKHNWPPRGVLKVKINERREAEIARRTALQRSDYEDPTKDAIEANAMMQADVIFRHRVILDRARIICSDMFHELDASRRGINEFAKLMDDLRLACADDDRLQARLRAASDLVSQIDKAFSLSSRSLTLQRLSGSLSTLVNLERISFGIKEDESDPRTGIEDLLRALGKAGADE